MCGHACTHTDALVSFMLLCFTSQNQLCSPLGAAFQTKPRRTEEWKRKNYLLLGYKALYILAFNRKLEARQEALTTAKSDKSTVSTDISLHADLKKAVHVKCITRISHNVKEPLKCRLETVEKFNLKGPHEVGVIRQSRRHPRLFSISRLKLS